MAITRSVTAIIRIIMRQLFWLGALLLIVLALYVSLGKQLLPLLAGYRSNIEQQLSESLGMQVQLGSVQGFWRQMNPGASLQQVQILLDSTQNDTVDSASPTGNTSTMAAAVQIDNLDLELNSWASLLQWRWVLETVNINGLEFEFVEQADGSWQLAGVNRRSAVNMTATQFFELASRFGNLELSQTSLNFHFLNAETQTLHDGQLRFQSRGQQHFLHLDAFWGDAPQPLSLSAELHGDRFSELSGAVHLLLPANDYSAFVRNQGGPTLELNSLRGAAEFWLQLQSGTLESLQAQVDLTELQLLQPADELRTEAALLPFSDLQANLLLQRSQSGWDLTAHDAGFSWQDMVWPTGDMSLQLRDSRSVQWQSEQVNIGLLNSLLKTLDVLPGGVQTALDALDPRGILQHLQLAAELGEQDSSQPGALQKLTLQTNLQDVGVNDFNGSPAIQGVQGFADLTYDAAAAQLRGQIEVDAQDLQLHLPGQFRDPWLYEYVNGRVNYVADFSAGFQLRLVSSVIEATSEIISGRARFATNFQRDEAGTVSSTLDLLVGALQADVSYKSLYLPRGPKAPERIQGVMDWVDAAVQGGNGSNSGVIFRGSIVQGSLPAEKTLQMFYHVEGGALVFDPQWPALEQIAGLVIVDDGKVDVRVRRGESLGIQFEATTAAVRRNSEGPGNWVTVTGSGQGEASQGLNYLQHTPVTQGFGAYLSDWQTSGDVGVELNLSIPLFIPDALPRVSVQLTLQDNTLHIPDLKLDFSAIQGGLTYDQDKGLSSENLTALLFGEPASFSLMSDGRQAEAPMTVLNMQGVASVEQLARWQRQTPLSLALLQRAEGQFQYSATLEIPQQRDSAPNSLKSHFSLSTDLRSTSLDFPEPLQKTAEANLPVSLEIDFLEEGAHVRASILDIVSGTVQLGPTGSIDRGQLLLGPRDETLPVRRFNTSAPGLEVLGRLERLDYDAWAQVFNDVLEDAELGTSSLRSLASLADVRIGELTVFTQQIDEISLQLSTLANDVLLQLESATVAGEIRFPAALDDYIDVHFTRLFIPHDEVTAEENLALAPEQPIDEERIDPFLNVDPRSFPRMRLRADAVRRGEADYGQWQLTVDPVVDGAQFTQVQIASRGLQVGSEDQAGTFFWRYDGQQHDSHLQAQVQADDLAGVLTAFGYAPSLESSQAVFDTDLRWAGSPGNFAATGLYGAIDLIISNGRFLQGGGGGSGALKLISILNFDALIRRLRFSDDLVRSGLAYDEINGSLALDSGIVTIVDRLQIIGPSSLYQIRGTVDLHQETIDGSMIITLPVSDNIPWLGGLAALNNLINWQVAVGVFLFDRIFGAQMDDLTSAQYVLQGPWDDLDPSLSQVFTAGDRARTGTAASDTIPVPLAVPAVEPN